MRLDFLNLIALAASYASAAPLASVSASDNGLRNYIIVFERGSETPERYVKSLSDTLKKVGATVNYEYHTVVKGFSVSLPPSAVDTLRTINDADFPFVIEEDQEVTTP